MKSTLLFLGAAALLVVLVLDKPAPNLVKKDDKAECSGLALVDDHTGIKYVGQPGKSLRCVFSSDGVPTYVEDSAKLAHEKRRQYLQALIDNGFFRTRCKSGVVDSGKILTDPDGVPYVGRCGIQPDPANSKNNYSMPGHSDWPDWVGRDSRTGKQLQREFEALQKPN